MAPTQSKLLKAVKQETKIKQEKKEIYTSTTETAESCAETSTIKCISEMLGVVGANEMIKYLRRNWFRINYKSAITNLLEKFESSIKNSAIRKKYVRVKNIGRRFLSEKYGDGTISDHFAKCNDIEVCKCDYIPIERGHTIILTIIQAYYDVKRKTNLRLN